jgi:hypothetical protein
VHNVPVGKTKDKRPAKQARLFCGSFEVRHLPILRAADNRPYKIWMINRTTPQHVGAIINHPQNFASCTLW